MRKSKPYTYGLPPTKAALQKETPPRCTWSGATRRRLSGEAAINATSRENAYRGDIGAGAAGAGAGADGAGAAGAVPLAGAAPLAGDAP